MLAETLEIIGILVGWGAAITIGFHLNEMHEMYREEKRNLNQNKEDPK